MSNRWSYAVSWILVGGLALPSAAEACSCMPSSLSQSWHESTDTFQGRIRGQRLRNGRHQYAVEIIRPFSGCTTAGEIVTVETPLSQASCGLSLVVGQVYLLTTSSDPARPVYVTHLCGYNLEWSSLTSEDREFLDSRLVVCPDAPELTICGDGSAPVACFVNSCQVEPSCAQAETCEFNPCGGCDAEYYDAWWTPVCE